MCPHLIRATVPQNEKWLWLLRMSPFSASKVKLVISFIFCCHVILPVRSPFNLPLLFTWQTSKPHNSKAQARFKEKKNSVSHQQISQLFSFIVACEVFELSRAKKKNEVKTNSRPSNARFFRTQQFQSARKRWQTSRDCLFFFFEWSNLKAKLTKTNAIFDHLLWKECRIIQYATDGWREPLPDF